MGQRAEGGSGAVSDIYNSKIARLIKWITRVPDSHCFGITTGPETTRYSCRDDQVSVRLRRHEDQHKRQYDANGGRLRFWYRYFKANIRYGYERNPFEIAVREAENYVQED